MEALQPLLTEDDLAISYLPGSGPDLVVAFTGIGALDGPHQKEEFIRVAGMEGQNHVAFVKDRLRSWFSAPGLQARIIAAVLALRRRLGPGRVMTLGNSMGGHGALLMAGRMGADVAVGFAPQYSMKASVIADGRWDQFRGRMTEDGLAELKDWVDGSFAAYAVFGAASDIDEVHRDLLNRLTPTQVWEVAGTAHNVGAALKARGVLAGAVAAMLRGDAAGLARALGARGVKLPKLTAPVAGHFVGKVALP
jgi:pimeloyl-ACP methyl ester carboxylesterase